MNWSERTDGNRFNKTTVVQGGAYAMRMGISAAFARKSSAVRRELNWLTHRMGNMAKDHVDANFRAESFIDDTPKRWPDRKRKVKSRPILVKTGKLKNSIRVTNRTRNSVSITTPVSYAGVHNRPVGEMKQYGPWMYPGRQFMGHSRQLADATHKMIITRLNTAMKA